jgi:hypothetical protein
MPYAYFLQPASSIRHPVSSIQHPASGIQFDLKFYLKGPIHVMNTIDSGYATEGKAAIQSRLN